MTDHEKYYLLLKKYNQACKENRKLKAILKDLFLGLSGVGEKLEQLKEIKG